MSAGVRLLVGVEERVGVVMGEIGVCRDLAWASISSSEASTAGRFSWAPSILERIVANCRSMHFNEFSVRVMVGEGSQNPSCVGVGTEFLAGLETLSSLFGEISKALGLSLGIALVGGVGRRGFLGIAPVGCEGFWVTRFFSKVMRRLGVVLGRCGFGVGACCRGAGVGAEVTFLCPHGAGLGTAGGL